MTPGVLPEVFEERGGLRFLEGLDCEGLGSGSSAFADVARSPSLSGFSA